MRVRHRAARPITAGKSTVYFSEVPFRFVGGAAVLTDALHGPVPGPAPQARATREYGKAHKAHAH